MVTKAQVALIVGAALLASAGVAAASGADVPRSIWGDSNPGKGAEHAAMPEAGAEHNHAGANHTDNRGGDHDDTSENETDDEPGEGAMPEALPEQANEHAQANFPPEHDGDDSDGA